ncbi:hypothetical protein KQI41_08125 [Tissierella pigra]|uniref:Uncharacterized protein n=1 Tax=Tissierella pigra TaxID=2607614 RepID=A0A6N7XKU9_9FIRM|nr:hypothetical protein [Tissierella pigra]MBU5426381.1 hypothetical protein [Tissierella pigra]MSU02206.1 hypothetical protein [Tissierella pigra]
MNFINFITIFIPLNFMAMYFLIKVRNMYFFIPIICIFYIKIFDLENKAYYNIPEDYKKIREKYIPKEFSVSSEKTFLMHYLDASRRRAIRKKKYRIKIFVMATIFMVIITKLYGEKAFSSIVELLAYMTTIMVILWVSIALYYDIKSYKKYIEIYGEAEKEIDKFLILKSALHLLTQLFAIVFMRISITRLYRPRRRFWRRY